MPLNIRKPIDNPDHISILLPTRGRPSSLRKVFASLEEMTRDKSLLDVWVYVDEDDVATNEYIQTGSWESHGFGTNWCIEKRAKSMGEMLNLLRERCTTNPGIYCPLADDNVVATRGWDVKVRNAFNLNADRIAMVFLRDTTCPPDQVTHVCLSAEWTNVLGRIITEYFPYWFDDCWLDRVAQMVGRKVAVDVRMEPIGGERGKSPQVHNLLFWHSFFCNMTDELIEDANALAQAIHTAGGALGLDEKKREGLARRFAGEKYGVDYPSLVAMEKEHAGEEKNPDYYERLHRGRRANALCRLRREMRHLLLSGRIFALLRVVENSLLAWKPYRTLSYRLADVAWRQRPLRQKLRNKHTYGSWLRNISVVGRCWTWLRDK